MPFFRFPARHCASTGFRFTKLGSFSRAKFAFKDSNYSIEIVK
jgi:hypothetical protein